MSGKLVTWFAIVLIVLLADAVLSYRAVRTLIRNEHLVSHTHHTLIELEGTLSTMREAETGQRGYLLTGRDEYLESYDSALANIDRRMKQVKNLTAGNSNEQRLVSVLEPMVKAKLDKMSDNIAVRRKKGSAAGQQIALSPTGKEIMDQIRQTIEAMKDAEKELLELRATESKASGDQALLTLFLISLLAALMLLMFYRQVRQSMVERTKLLAEEQAAHGKAAAAYETEQQARTEAEQANRLKDEFLATVSHELRTPLTSLIGWTRMLQSGRLDEPTTTRALQTIERNALSQAQLVEDLLDGSRIISGKLRLDVRTVDVAQVIESAIDTIRPAAAAKRIRLSSVLDPRCGLVSGDPDRLQQVVWNLLSNAVKFTPKYGRVQVRLERVNSHLEIIVSDTGQGIGADFLPHVFERFRQADSSISRAQGGLGLGLAITRNLVEMQGGSVHVDSPGEGEGATFTVKLPIVALRSAGISQAGQEERVHPTAGCNVTFDNLPELAGLRVLAVDDQPDTLDMITSVLSQCGADVETSTSAAAAFAKLGLWKPDVIIADIGMPDEDGYSLIKRIRALAPEQGGTIPAVALTAYARVEDRLRSLSSGYQMHVPKPVEPVELMTIVASLASNRGKAAGL